MKYSKLFLLFLLVSSIVSQAQRLSGDVIPTSYQLTFAPDLKLATFTGKEVIEVTLSKPSTTITMNCAEIKIETALVISGEVRQPSKITYDEKQEQVTFTLDQAVPRGPARIEIQYTGILNDQLRGFYLSKSKTRNYATTQFENTDARRAFPSFDEPASKATFDITLIVDRGDTAFSNGKQISDTAGPGENKHTVKFATTAKMSTYLVAMVVGDLACQKGEVDGIPLRVCATPQNEHLLSFALDATQHVVHFYNQYYGIKYPYGKLDQLGIPDFSAGAMENTAAITYRETFLLVDDKKSTTGQCKNVADAIAHEIAHQWFGDLVTMKWWDDIWLNEGFATWMSSKPLKEWQPKWNMGLDEVQGTQDALRLDSLASTRPIHQAANTPEEIAALFDGIAYGKTAAVLRMVENYVGPAAFRTGVNQYLEKYKYSNTEAKDFWNAITAASGKPVDKVMPTFVNQAGAPLIRVTVRCSEGKTQVDLQQQRLYIDPQLEQTGAKQTWQIPVCLKTFSDEKTSCSVLREKEQTVSLNGCSTPIFTNARGVGYYRTLYSEPDVAKIGVDAEAKLTAAERVSFLGDVWSAAYSGKQNVALFLNLVKHFQKERSRAVMESVLDPIDRLHEKYITEAQRPAFEAWVRKLLQPVLLDLGMKPVPGEDPDLAVLRASVMHTLGVNGDAKVRQYAEAIVQAYMNDPQSVVADQVPWSFDLVTRDGDAVLYEKMLEKRKNAKDPYEFYRYQNSLSNFRDPALVKRTLDMSLSPEVRSQDLGGVLGREFNNAESQAAALKFLENNYDEIHKRTISTLGEGFGFFVGDFCDRAIRDNAKKFFESKNLPGNERALKLGVENSDACIHFKERQSQNLTSWLNSNQ